MAAKELGYDGRYERLAPVLEESYDFPFMTRIATATAWRCPPDNVSTADEEVGLAGSDIGSLVDGRDEAAKPVTSFTVS